MQDYDVIVVGAGPAGLTAALYCARARLRTLVLEKGACGGQLATTDEIENYPGFPKGIGGSDLAALMREQAERFGAERLAASARGLDVRGPLRVVRTDRGELSARAVILASGVVPRPLGCPGEQELRGRGVSYCAVCDAAFFEGARVVVAGGGDAAVEEAMYLGRFADQVTLVHRRDSLRATRVVQERALADPKLTILWDTVIKEIKGTERVEAVTLHNLKSGTVWDAPADGVFVYVGLAPNSVFFENIGPMDDQNYIKTDEFMRTATPGVYAVGDIRQKMLRQVVTAASDGAIAAVHAEKYIQETFS